MNQFQWKPVTQISSKSFGCFYSRTGVKHCHFCPLKLRHQSEVFCVECDNCLHRVTLSFSQCLNFSVERWRILFQADKLRNIFSARGNVYFCTIFCLLQFCVWILVLKDDEYYFLMVNLSNVFSARGNVYFCSVFCFISDLWIHTYWHFILNYYQYILEQNKMKLLIIRFL